MNTNINDLETSIFLFDEVTDQYKKEISTSFIVHFSEYKIKLQNNTLRHIYGLYDLAPA